MLYFHKTALSKAIATALIAGSALVGTGVAGAAEVVTYVNNLGAIVLPYSTGFGHFENVLSSASDFFINDYSFSIGTSGSFSGGVVSIELFNILAISDLSMRLVSGPGWSGTVPSTLTSVEMSTRVSNTLAFDSLGAIVIAPYTLTPGNYFFEVSGRATGLSGGSYGGNINVAAVPEPTGALMALAGIGFLAFGLRRARA